MYKIIRIETIVVSGTTFFYISIFHYTLNELDIGILASWNDHWISPLLILKLH